MEEFFHSVTAWKILFVLGFVNGGLGILLFFSCRCIPMSAAIGRRFMKYGFYKRFYGLHCYLWPVLMLSVVAHSVLAYKFLGNPF
ncbi:MAG: hypothetical protein HQ553_16320 [Chloroflexi bacterium]|nr:hypothetical protein [Chloroflexota bacterium]